MNLSHYTYFARNNFKEYEFYSEGPKGRIKKVVMFTKMQDDLAIYNLAFGDEDPETGVVSDLVTTDNKDTAMVLATVANTILDFCDRYGDHYIYARGSTIARTRLYQIGISSLLNEISMDFDIIGSKNGILHEFQRNVNYDAFLVKRK
ncbi:MAG: hypothetical protein JWL97_4100 [Gemmatimonadales bacterium]|nr:hypothetical protein [Gemmatimonadales bacterium]